jgi:hypothetical protein
MPDSATAEPWHRRTDADDGWSYRVDRGALLRPVVRSDGTLLVEGFAAREGVLEYRQGDGKIRRELVTSDVLAESAAGLARAPVTLEHPREDVGPDNVGKLGVGDTDGEVAVLDGGFVRVRIAVRRRDAIDAVKGGKHELSPGYRVRVDNTPGVHPVHGRYDARQVARSYNHLAIVDVARGGPDVRLRADSADAVSTTTIEQRSDHSGARPQGALMKPIVAALVAALGLTQRYDSDDTALEAALSETRRRKDADNEFQRKLDSANAERDAQKTRADAAEAKVAALEQAERARTDAAERAELDGLAKALGVTGTHADAASLRRAIAAKHLGELKADASDDYVRAVVDLAKVDQAKRGDGREAGRRAWEGPPAPPRTDSASAQSGRPSLFQIAQKRGDSMRSGSGGEA